MGWLLHLQVTNSKELFTFPLEQRKRREKIKKLFNNKIVEHKRRPWQPESKALLKISNGTVHCCTITVTLSYKGERQQDAHSWRKRGRWGHIPKRTSNWTFKIIVRPAIKRITAQLSEERTEFYPCPNAARASEWHTEPKAFIRLVPQYSEDTFPWCWASILLWSIKLMTWVFFYFHSNIWRVHLGVGILHGDYSFCLRMLKNWVRGTNAAEAATGEQIALQKNLCKWNLLESLQTKIQWADKLCSTYYT